MDPGLGLALFRRFPRFGLLAAVATLYLTGPSSAVDVDDPAGSRFFPAVTVVYAPSWSYLATDPITISGTVLKLKYFNCEIFCDGDLNVFIKPDPEFAWVARNPRPPFGNRLNPTLEDGQIPREAIEAEVGTIQGFVEHYFTPGTKLWIEGWWVDDAAHSNKTEVHPIRYMLAKPLGQDNKWSIFMAQDLSDRFHVANWDHSQHFDFGMPGADSINTEKPAGVSDGGVLIETSVLDAFSGAPRSGYNLTWSQLPTEPSLRVNILMHAPVWEVPDVASSYLPFYSAQFERTTKPVYEDAVTHSVQTNNAGQKYLQISVNAKWLGTGTDLGLQVSYWRVDKGPNEEPETATILNSPHVFNFTREYSPALGKTSTAWTLQAIATTRGVNVPPRAVDIGSDSRVSVHKQREYKIEPSGLALQIGGSSRTYTRAELQRDPRPGLAFLSDPMYCRDDRSVTAVEHLLPKVNSVAGTFFWSVRVPQARIPTQVAVDDRFRLIPPTGIPGWITISPQAPFEDANVKATVNPTNDHRLDLQWKQGFGHLDVRARVDTDIGEKVEAVTQVKQYCAVSGSGLDGFLENIYKGLLILEKLKSLGLLTDPIPQDFSRRVPTVPFGSPEEPYEIMDKLPKPYREVFGGFLKLVSEQPLTVSEWNQLNRFAAASSRIRWTKPVPAEAFKTVTLGRRVPREPAKNVAPHAKYPSGVVIPWGKDPIIVGPPKYPVR